MSKESIRRFIEWNKKQFNDPTPVAAFKYHKDDNNEQLKVFLLGSWFSYSKTITDDDRGIKQVIDVPTQKKLPPPKSILQQLFYEDE